MEEGRDIRAGAGRGEKGLDHLEVCELELAEDDGGLEDARGRQGGAKGRARNDVIHGCLSLGCVSGFGLEGSVEVLLCWNVVVKRVFRGVVDGSWRQDKDENCRHHDGKWLYKPKLRALQMATPVWDGKDGSMSLRG